MRRSTTRTFRTRRPKQDVKWATPGIIADQIIASATTLSQSLLVDADWDDLLSFERVTLLRIRGWLSLAQTASSATTGFFWAIQKVPITLTPPNPLLAASYTDNDTLLTGGAQAGTSTTTTTQLSTIPIDVKTKRVLTPQDSILFTIRASGTGSGRVSGFLRCLWAYK